MAERTLKTWRKLVAPVGLVDARAAWIGHQIFFVALAMDLFYKLGFVGAVYGPFGALPREACQAAFGDACLLKWSMFGWLDSDHGVRVGLVLAIALCVLACAGYRRGWVYFCLIFALVSFKVRFPFGLTGGDYQAPWLVLAFSLFSSARPGLLAGRAFLGHVLVFYVVAGFAKSGPTWLDGTAISHALAFTPVSNPGFDWLGSWDSLSRPLTYFVLYLERFAAFFLLLPNRYWRCRLLLVLAFAFAHMGMAITLHTPPLVWYAIAIWAVFLPPPVMAYLASWVRVPVLRCRSAAPALLAAGKFALALGAIASLWCIPAFQSVPALGSLYRSLARVGAEPNWRFFAPDPLQAYVERRFFGSSADGVVQEIDPAAGTLAPSPFPAQLRSRQGIYADRLWSRLTLNLVLPKPNAPQPLWLAQSLCRRFPQLERVWLRSRVVSTARNEGFVGEAVEEVFSCR